MITTVTETKTTRRGTEYTVSTTTVTGTIESMTQDGFIFTYVIDGETIKTSSPIYRRGIQTLSDGTEVQSDMIVAAEGDEIAFTTTAEPGKTMTPKLV